MYTPRENFLRFLKGESYEWKPLSSDRKPFQPADIPLFVARGFVAQQAPFDAANYGGMDWLGVDWWYDPDAKGSMERGAPILDDISEWEEKVQFLDLDTIDWEGIAAANAEYLNTDKLLTTTIFSGFFERLIALMGFENGCMALIDEEQQEDVHALFSRLADYYIDFAKRMHKYFNVEYLTLHDDWGAQRSLLFSKDTHTEMIAHYIRRVIEAIQADGMVYEQHSCGNIYDLIPSIIESGANTWLGQMTVVNLDKEQLVREYGDQFKFGVAVQPDGPVNGMEDAKAIMQKYLDLYKDKTVWFSINPRQFSRDQLAAMAEMCKAAGK